MKTTACLAVFILSLFMAPLSFGMEAVAGPGPEAGLASDTLKKAIGDAIQKVRPSLVRIFVVAVRYENGRELKYVTVGSGVIISKEGYVITNHHVAGNAKQIVCTLSDKEEVQADLTGTDPLADIAVIKLRNAGKREYPAVEFGDSSLLKVGDRVLAMGCPYALSQSVTMGIVSNTEVVLPEFLPSGNKMMLEGENVGSLVRWIGHDAQIYGGNSGGPLVNLKGEIVGINEINIGLSGAIPGNLAKEVSGKLMTTGKVKRSWFGLDIQPLLRNEKKEAGALISGVVNGSPAERAGFLPGDILVAIDGRDVSVRFPEEVPILNQMLSDIPVGGKVEAVVERGDKKLRLGVTSQEREYVMQKNVEFFQWGMTARNLSFMDSKEMKRETRDGVLVTSVRPGGPCRESEPKVATGDVIVEVAGKAVRNVGDLQKLTSDTMKDKKTPVPVLATFDRDNERYITVVNLSNKKEDEGQGVEALKPWISVSTQVVTKEIAASLGDPALRGMRVTRVFPGGRAEKDGIRVGDVITALNKEAVNPSSVQDSDMLVEMVHQYDIGSEAELTILRGKEKVAVGTVLEESPRSQKDMKRYTDIDFEFTVRDISSLDDLKEDGGKNGGVLVESVSEGGWAALARLAIGDIVLAVDGAPVSDTASFESEMKRASVCGTKTVVFKVLRGIHTMFIEMEPVCPDVN